MYSYIYPPKRFDASAHRRRDGKHIIDEGLFCCSSGNMEHYSPSPMSALSHFKGKEKKNQIQYIGFVGVCLQCITVT